MEEGFTLQILSTNGSPLLTAAQVLLHGICLVAPTDVVVVTDVVGTTMLGSPPMQGKIEQIYNVEKLIGGYREVLSVEV